MARDVEAEVTTQGETRAEALENIDEAIALQKGDIGREPTGEELGELGIDPAMTRPVTRNRRTYSIERWGGERFRVTKSRRYWSTPAIRVATDSGDDAQLYYAHPTNEDDRRQVTVPLHDELRIGTLRDVAQDAGARDFEDFCDWIDGDG